MHVFGGQKNGLSSEKICWKNILPVRSAVQNVLQKPYIIFINAKRRKSMKTLQRTDLLFFAFNVIIFFTG